MYAFAQHDSTVVLQEIEITQKRIADYAHGDHIDLISGHSIVNNRTITLSEGLTKFGGINVRSYGFAGLSSASFRGTGSNHSAIFWDGFNLQSVMNGGADLNLVPVSFVDQVSLQYGGSSSLFGSGTLGGAIHLSSDDRFGDQSAFSIGSTLQYGSFGNKYFGLNSKYSNSRKIIEVRVFHQGADNDFSYTYQGESRNIQNAQNNKSGLLFNSTYRIKDASMLKVKYWAQKNHLNIPEPIFTDRQGIAEQRDNFHRLYAQYLYAQPNWQLSAKSGIFFYELNYDNGSSINSTSDSFTSISEVLGSFEHQSWKMETGLNHTYESASTQNYGNTSPSRNHTALSISNSFNLQRWELSVVMRESIYDGTFSPFTTSVGASFQIENLRLRAKIANSFRLPTFNDLYWTGASQGNPNLKPENGKSFEIGLDQSKTIDKSQISSSITFFYNNISDWIQWRPFEGSRWSPINIDEIWSVGIEARAKYSTTLKNAIKLDWNINYNLIRSTKESLEKLIPINETQLAYTPKHQGNISTYFRWKNLGINYDHQFTGQQFTNDLGSAKDQIKAYHTADLALDYTWKVNTKNVVQGILRINNLGNRSYEVRRGYPMPNRNYKITITYNFN